MLFRHAVLNSNLNYQSLCGQLFNTKSPDSLATIVGVLTEVPVMLILVRIANKTRIVCSKCKSQDITQIYSGININTKSSAKTSPNGCCGGSGCCR